LLQTALNFYFSYEEFGAVPRPPFSFFLLSRFINLKHKRGAKSNKSKRYFGLSIGSWVVIVVLGILTVLPDFPIDFVTGIADILFLVWSLSKQ
jgi:hypothetical protein